MATADSLRVQLRAPYLIFVGDESRPTYAKTGQGMDIMVGNMTGSSLSMAPSYVIGQHCRFVDIDGPLLLSEDVDHGLNYGDGGRVGPPASVLWG